MGLTTAQLQALKTEFTTDPRGYGYAQYWSGTAQYDGGLQALVNDVRDGVVHTVNGVSCPLPTTPAGASGDPSGVIKVNFVTVDTGAIRSATTYAAYNGLVTGDRTWFNWLTGAGEIAVNADNLLKLAGIPTATGSVWASGDRTTMNAAMAALLQRTGSRAEELFGTWVSVSINDISACRTA